MPFYSIQHVTSLTTEQQDGLAEAITSIHANLFTVPKLFINVSFQDVTGESRYVGGRRSIRNVITAQVRHGPTRTQEHYAELMKQIEGAWNKHVPDAKLHRVSVNGGLVAGKESGVVLPASGGDKAWIAENWKMFNERADAGDEDMQAIVADIRERGLIGDGRTAMQKLEEALGWGDSA